MKLRTFDRLEFDREEAPAARAATPWWRRRLVSRKYALALTHRLDRAFPGEKIEDDVVTAEVTIGDVHPGAGAEVKIGTRGSEEPLAAHLHLGRVAFLAVALEGTRGHRIAARLNRTDGSRVFALAVGDRRLRWDCWARRHEWRSTDPRWMTGSVRLDLRDLVFGELRNTWITETRAEGTVRMPHGDDHPVALTLERWTQTRTRGWRPARRVWWSVNVDVLDGGIPTKPGDRGRILEFHVDIDPAAVDLGHWSDQALARAAERMTAERVRYGYRPVENVGSSR